MKFEVVAKVEKQLWTNDTTWLYKVIETQGDKQKPWVIFTKQVLPLEQSFKFSGYVSSSVDKKRTATDNKPINNTSFNAEMIIEDTDFPF
jgi:hypothetical protein